MRKLIVCNIMSLDGYYEGPGKDVMAMPMDMAFDPYYLQLMEAADTLLLGRTSYEGFIGFWPPLADQPDAPAVQQGIGRLHQTLHKVVVSDSLTRDGITAWADTTEVVGRADIAGRLAELKGRPGRDILTFGSREMWSVLAADGLVDELHLLVGAGVLADGTRLFDRPLSGIKLLEARAIDDSDGTLLRYALV